MKYLPILLALLLCACGGNKQAAETAPTAADTLFKMVEIPEMVPDKRSWLALHFWDKADLADTVWLSNRPVMEQQVRNFIEVMMAGVSKEDSDRALRTLLDKASVNKEIFLMTGEVIDQMLYDPNSPVRNEAMYVPVLQYMIASPLLDEAEKERPRFQLEMAAKNNPGDPAADFVYTLPDGKTGRLSQLDAPFVIIYFYNPDCHGCAEMTDALKRNPIVDQTVASGEMIVLALYPDADQTIWRDHFADMDPRWIIARDNGEVIKDRKLYDLKAIPTLYLLDWEKKVLLKDATAEQLEGYLNYLVELQQQAQQGMY